MIVTLLLLKLCTCIHIANLISMCLISRDVQKPLVVPVACINTVRSITATGLCTTPDPTTTCTSAMILCIQITCCCHYWLKYNYGTYHKRYASIVVVIDGGWRKVNRDPGAYVFREKCTGNRELQLDFE